MLSITGTGAVVTGGADAKSSTTGASAAMAAGAGTMHSITGVGAATTAGTGVMLTAVVPQCEADKEAITLDRWPLKNT